MGEVKKRENWGLRNLAYRMNKNRKGHYVLFNIDAPAPEAAWWGAKPLPPASPRLSVLLCLHGAGVRNHQCQTWS